MTSLPFYPPPSRALSGLTVPRSRPSTEPKSTDSTSTPAQSGSSWRNRAQLSSGKHRKPSFLASPVLGADSDKSGTTTPDRAVSGPAAQPNYAATSPAQQQGPGHVYTVSTSSSGTSGSVISSMPSSAGSKQPDSQSSDTDVNHVQTGANQGRVDSAPISRTASTSDLTPQRKQTSMGDRTQKPRTTNTLNTPPSGSSPATGGGRLGSRLPQGLFFDRLRSNEVSAAHKLELECYDPHDDAASFDAFKYRMNSAPHLFYGAFLPLPLPKVSGPLSMSGPRPRKLIGFVCGTAASAYTARAFKWHQEDEDAWLVCVHSVVVAKDHQRKGLALKIMEEYMKRLRRAEEGKGGKEMPKQGYECVAVLAHEEMVPLFEKASFHRFRVSHITSGTGEWIEMRRKIISTDEDEDEGQGDDARLASSAILSASSSSVGSPKKSQTPPSVSSAMISKASDTPRQILNEGDAVRLSPKSSTSADDDEKPPSAWLSDRARGVQSPSETSPVKTAKSDAVEGRTGAGHEQAGPKEKNGLPGPKGRETAPPFSQAQLLAALQNQSKAAKNDTGVAYSTIMGQTLASKTSVEDAFYALEARLVNREDMTNLADLLCPREDCGCCLLREGTSDWEMAELGPLATGDSALPNDSGAPAPVLVAPPLKGISRIRNAFGTPTPTSEAKMGTPPRPFWIVQSPMIFDNIGFSRDVEWMPPPPSRSSLDEGDGKKTSTNEATRGGVRRRLTRGSSIFLKNAMKREKSGSRHEQSESTSPTSPLSSVLSRITKGYTTSGDSAVSPSSPEETKPFATPAPRGAEAEGIRVMIKYLMCAECDFGPLGYTVLPQSLQGPNFAQEVGKQAQAYARADKDAEDPACSSGDGSSRDNDRKEDSQPTSSPSSSPTKVVQQAVQSTPYYYIAADRVRYRFRK